MKSSKSVFVLTAALGFASPQFDNSSCRAGEGPATPPGKLVITPPTGPQPYGSNWFGFLPTNCLYSFSNGVVYVDAKNGKDTAAGYAQGTNAFKHIYKAVDSTTNT